MFPLFSVILSGSYASKMVDQFFGKENEFLIAKNVCFIASDFRRYKMREEEL
jgi:hypothetical protein